MSDYVKFAQVARETVAQAAFVCRQVQAALDDVRSITKDDKSPVTVADFASQAIIARALSEAFGEGVILVAEEASAFLREEEHAPHLEATLAAVREVWPDATAESMLAAVDVGTGDTHHAGFWTLDPIDGTKGFLRGQQYAIALAYVERGEPVVGALGCPNLAKNFSVPLDEPDANGCLYTAIKGDGVEECAADDPRGGSVTIKRLDHAQGEAIGICASVEKAHSSVSDTDRVMELIAKGGHAASEPSRLDSQAKYAVVARGQADAYLRLPAKKGYIERIWDHAAGALVASEAGCFVTDIFGRGLDFTHGRGLEKNKGIVCAPPRVHGLLIGAIEELRLGRS